MRNRIAELRARLMSGSRISPEEEQELLREIETLRASLRLAEGGSPSPDPAEFRETTSSRRERRSGPSHEAVPSAENRRKAERYRITVPFHFTILALPDDERLSEALDSTPSGKHLDDRVSDTAQSADLSVGGMRLTCSLPLPEGTLILLEIPYSAASARKVRAKAEVKWSRRREGENWEVAVVFTGLDPVTERWLTELRAAWSS